MMFDDTNHRLRATMFENGNRVSFVKAVDDKARDWWLSNFFDKHGLTPEGMGEALTRSVAGDKSVVYATINGRLQEFSLKVSGGMGNGTMWFVDRSFHLTGGLFNAHEMFVPPADRGRGIGRKLMADLIETSKLIDARVIKISARDIGRYAWLRMGFKPDTTAWNDMKGPLLNCLEDVRDALGDRRTDELVMQVARAKSGGARMLAELNDPVPSRTLRKPDNSPLDVPLGRTLFLEYAGDWDGQFDVGNDGDVREARHYADR